MSAEQATIIILLLAVLCVIGLVVVSNLRRQLRQMATFNAMMLDGLRILRRIAIQGFQIDGRLIPDVEKKACPWKVEDSPHE